MEKQSIEEYVYEQLKLAIFARKIPLNTQLSEELLSEAFNVSRTPIRSVLKKLSYEKIIEFIPNKGAYIYQPSEKELEEVMQLRKLIEKEAIKNAIKHVNEEKLKELIDLTYEEEKYFRNGEYEKGIQLTSRFHEKLVELSDNEIFSKYNKELINITTIYLVFHETVKKESPRSPEEHRNIINAMLERDTNKALELFEQHFCNIRKNLNSNKKQENVDFKEIFKPYSR